MSRVADIVPVVNPVVIKRQDSGARAIYAGTEGGRAATSAPTCRRSSRRRSCRPGYRFDVGGQTKEQAEAFQGVIMALGAAVIFVYIVLASQFGSFLQPLAIMASPRWR